MEQRNVPNMRLLAALFLATFSAISAEWLLMSITEKASWFAGPFSGMALLFISVKWLLVSLPMLGWLLALSHWRAGRSWVLYAVWGALSGALFGLIFENPAGLIIGLLSGSAISGDIAVIAKAAMISGVAGTIFGLVYWLASVRMREAR